MASRPLSPHLQVWKWGPHMLISILHRVTGNAMAFVGLPLLLWFLASLASGPDGFEAFGETVWIDWGTHDWSGGGILTGLLGVFFLLALVFLSWAFFHHMMSGIRHFVLDVGAGYELRTNKTWSMALPVLSILLTIAFWAALLLT